MKIKQDFNSSALEIIQVDPCQEETLDLLKQAYKEVFSPLFPVADSNLSLSAMMDRISGPPDNLQYAVIIAGTNLDDKKKRVIHGMCAAAYFPETQAGLMEYNAIAPHSRNNGLGRKMVELRKQALEEMAADNGQTLKSIIVEVNDPDKVKPEDDSIDPKVRLAAFKKWGARQIPMNYVAPHIEKGKMKYRNLLLLAYPVDGKYPGSKEVLGYVESIYGLYLGKGYESDKDFLAMKKELSQWDGTYKGAPTASVPKPPTL